MTRSTVSVSSHELLDVFHDRDIAVAITVGGAEAGKIVVPEPSPSDITVRGYQDVVDDTEFAGTFEVRFNGDQIAEGYLHERLSSAVTAEIGSSIIEVPPSQRIEIDVWGDRVNGGDA